MSNDSSPACPRCGAPLAAGRVEGLCARCLGALNFATSSVLSEETPVAPVAALRVEELAPHFPQLEILECLGRGGMGVVYKARQKSLHRFVALKLLAPERAAQPGFAERFAREAQALAALSHPHIVTVYDFGQAGGFYFLLMEFVDGVNLRQAMNTKRFTPEQALAVVPPVCEALQYAHEHGIVHRDIKPENLLLDREGRVKIADFGIAKMLGDNAPAGLAESQPAGTPQYMAPEQKEHERTDHRADIYSLGVVLYEMLTGERPTEKIEPPSRRVQVDVRIDEIVLRALEKTPELRFQTAAEMRTSLETIAGSARSERQPPADGGRDQFLAPCLVLAALCLANGFYLAATASQLPDRPAIHFDVDGTPNGWMNRSTYLLVGGALPLLFVALFALVAQGVKWFPSLINIPRRDYWLAPERRAETVNLLLRRFLWLVCLQTVFFGALHALVLEANRVSPPRLPSGPLLVWVIGFFLVLMIWIIALLVHLAEAEHGRWKTRSSGRFASAGPKPATGSPAEPVPATAQQRLLHALGFRDQWSQRLLLFSLPGFLGFLGAIPGWHGMTGCLVFFAFLAAAVAVENHRRRIDPGTPPRTWWQKAIVSVVIAAAAALFVRAFLLCPYVITGNSAAPEIPAGSRILVWRPARQFVPGDLVAYQNGRDAYVGRVIRGSAADIVVNRNGQPDLLIPRFRVIGKVISVYWRATPRGPSPVSDDSSNAAIGIALASKDGHLFIGSLFPNAPASLDGRLQPGDELVSFGETPATMESAAGQSIGECVQGMRGKPGSPITLRVIPAGKTAEQAYELTLNRQLIAVLEAGRLGQLGGPHPASAAIRESAPVGAVKAYRGDIDVWLSQVGTVGPPKDHQAPPTPSGRQDEPVTLLFAIPENYTQMVVKKLDAGQHPAIEAYDAAATGKLVATGSLVGVDNQIDAATGTLPCKAVVQPKADVLLYPNQSVSVDLLVETKSGVTLIPAGAVQFSSNGPVVFVIGADDRASVRRVSVGVRDRERYEVTEGLTPGEIVLANPVNLPPAGVKLDYQLQETAKKVAPDSHP